MRALAWFLGLFAAALVAIALFTYPAWLLLHPYFDFPFHRIGERIGMLALLAGFLLVARRLGVADRTSLGYGSARREFVREMLIGLALFRWVLGSGPLLLRALIGILAVPTVWLGVAINPVAQISTLVVILIAGIAADAAKP